MNCLVANLDTVQAQYDQALVELKLKETLDGLKGGLSYKEALDLVNTIANDEDLNMRKELAVASEKLVEQRQAALDAAEKVAKAEQDYAAAQKAVEEAREKLKALEEKGLNSTAAKAQLEKSKGELYQSKQDKEDRKSTLLNSSH